MDELFVGYNAWAAEKLDIAMSVDLVYEEKTEGGDRGVYVSEDILPQTTVLSIPAESLLNVHTMAQSPLKDLLSLPLCEDDMLAWFLMYETFLNPSSKWKRHLDVLPKTFHNILYFTQDEIDMLEGSNVYYVAMQLQKQVASDFAALQQTLLPDTLRLLSADFSAETLLDAFSMNHYKWALSVIWSRFVSVALDEDILAKSMVPVFDMFNHDPTAQMTHGFDPTTNSFVLRTHQHWSAGSQIFINYGALPNHKLLPLYGFVLASNPFDAVELYAPMGEDAPDFSRKLELLEDHGLAEHVAGVPFELFADSVNDELLAYLRIQRLDGGDLRSAAVEKSHFAFELVHDDNEKDALASLIYALQQMLDAFPTSIEEDLEALVATEEDPDQDESHLHMALQLRISDKKILLAQIEMLQELLLPVIARINQANLQD
ncbi:Aste57867_15011 [Aphanomyces stellatus]|uniref:Aste57867_15011 protein n=1 Tax=Aphanomyces stellatus TaxID=120398 RepID=A0A485L3E1_9STRA|nr:hypothetical protein As57867_014955 [Aphanomyces stellatus]KAF0709503.1 hypothetical protein As57867_005880 [Aphanomyces stellatus]KAF0714636.1 hypothetical protein As57867_003759 [Aphanomyces stellatus]VFT80921.1 Aste57867_3770 [Aphanomyces stellatus]VFT82915.1 Aste57867_5894 [Aphanomyces stellatus]